MTRGPFWELLESLACPPALAEADGKWATALERGLRGSRLKPSDFEYTGEYRGDIYFFRHRKSGRRVLISDDGEFFRVVRNDYHEIPKTRVLSGLG